MTHATASELAIRGGPKAVTADPGDIFAWPIVTDEDEQAVLDVLRRGAMSGLDVTLEFEKRYAAWHGVRRALGFCNGTAALLGAMWACGVGVGDEIICPSVTYWASALPALSLGATVNFADIDPDTLCIDPADIEHRIGERTKAIVVVHLYGHPCDMDPILETARKHKVKVIEDASHAHGALYKGRMVGTIGDVGCFSLMAGKAFATGEAGILITNDRAIWERAVAFGFYERTGASRYAKGDEAAITDPQLVRFAGLPMGGFKHRMNQTCSAMGLVQLKHYPRRMAEIQKAMNYFWDELAGVPGIRPHRVAAGSGSTMGGWYVPVGLYDAAALGGLPIGRFVEAVVAEGARCGGLPNKPLHVHPLFHEADIYGHGKPTVLAHAARDVRQGPGTLPVCEAAPERVFSVPWFKHCRPEVIDQHVAAYRKVAEQAGELLKEEA
ncbi:MAG TPA: DegT/DnrJ/EryC1/StrS family aminotransferase [Phycisphaerae bacterium]|nr:DegT/DnrJ/EryC1/StrS family aminotransferase [Phycisphaerae bacterium]